MSVSLVDDGRLWGLIACHHYAGPHRPAPADRVAAEFLGRTASLLLHTKADEGDAARVLDVAERSARLVGALARTPRRPAAALVDAEVEHLLPAGGAAVRLAGRLVLLGSTPAADDVTALLDALPDRTTATDAVLTLVPDGEHLVPAASGVLAVPVPGSGWLAWFRPETLREVRWGGDPDQARARRRPLRAAPVPAPVLRGVDRSRCARRPRRGVRTRSLRPSSSRATSASVASRRAEEESQVAAALQRTLLLERLPQVPGVALAARCLPSAADVVGGDWYDLVLLPSGRVSIVLGDVAGHGLGAAAVTAQLRHALRAFLLSSPGPAAALGRLNDLAAHLLPEELATAVVAELDAVTGRLAVANAGHLPVLLLGAGGPVLLDAARGPALGMQAGAAYDSAELQLRGDDRLVLFTDGLVELRGPDLDERFAQLLDVAASAPRDPEALLEVLLERLAPPDDDDVTVVVLGPSA